MDAKLSRRELLALAAAGSALAAIPTFAAAQAPEKKKVVIAVGGKNLLYYLPLTVAEQLGYFKDEGLDVEIETSPAAPRRCRRWSAAARMWSPAPSSTRSICS